MCTVNERFLFGMKYDERVSHVEGVLAFSFSIEGKKDHICFFFHLFFSFRVTGNYSPHIIENL